MEEKKMYETPDAEFVELDEGDDIVVASACNYYGTGCTDHCSNKE